MGRRAAQQIKDGAVNLAALDDVRREERLLEATALTA
jgi:hypothetical protein